MDEWVLLTEKYESKPGLLESQVQDRLITTLPNFAGIWASLEERDINYKGWGRYEHCVFLWSRVWWDLHSWAYTCQWVGHKLYKLTRTFWLGANNF